MSFPRYLLAILRRAIESAWKSADTTAAILGLLAGLLTWLLPRVEPYVEVATWAIPLAILLPLFLYRLVAAPFFLLLEQNRAAEKAQSELAAILSSRPHITLSAIRDAQLYRDGRALFRPTQVWLVNAPQNPQPGSIAYGVSAVIEFTNQAAPHQTLRVFGQWALTDAPEFVGYSALSSTTDIPPSHIPSKLMVALKHPQDSSAYALSAEALSRHEDGRDPLTELPPGIYAVVIHIRGVGVDERFVLRLDNGGIDSTLRLTVSDESPTPLAA